MAHILIHKKMIIFCKKIDTYCPVDFAQLEKLDQFLSKVQMVHIMLYFPTITSTNGSHNVVFSNTSRTF